MDTIKFKTTIKCAGCVATVTPFLNEAVGAHNWSVDTQSSDKILSVKTNETRAVDNVLAALKQAGHKAEWLN